MKLIAYKEKTTKSKLLLSTISPSPAIITSDIIDKVKQRSFYAGFLVKAAIVKTASGPAVSTALAVGFDKPYSPRPSHDYGPLLLEEQWYSKAQFLDWVNDLSEKMTFKLANGGKVVLNGSWQPLGSLAETYPPSNYQYIQTDWPANFYKYGMQTGIVNPPSTILSPIDLPLFPNGSEAVEWWFGVGELARLDFFGKVVILLPNMVAKISTVQIGSEKLSVVIEKHEKTVKPLVRVFSKDYRTGNRTLKDQELDMASDSAEIEVEPEWTYLKIVLANRQTGEGLDSMDIHAGWSDLPKGVSREVGPEDLLEAIRRGENEEVDFKETLTNSDDIVKTVIAFANTKGGVLLIGVNDECQVVGVKEDLEVIDQKIRNWVRNWCEQTVQLEVQTKKILDKEVVAILVRMSANKPCWMKEKGPFIRYGANNRFATRAEVETMLRKDSNPFSSRGL